MKLLAMFLFIGAIQMSAIVTAQNDKLDVKVKNIQLSELLWQLQEKSGLVFVYQTDDLEGVGNITVNKRDVSIQELLNEILSTTDLDFTVNNDVVIINKKEPRVVPVIQNPQAHVITIKGVVRDELGEPLPGVTVVIKGSTQGVITGMDGDYNFPNVPKDAILQFSFIGMASQDVSVSGQSTIDVVLKSVVSELKDVVVVGFGSQKKKSVVGAINSIKPAELKVPSSNLTTALAGRVSGLISYQRSGEPGADNAEFFVRGVTTFGLNKSPLILIDGVELTPEDLARIQPDNIASFSILKDATTTAIYGARGANGVILVTTKEGTEGKVKVSARVENAWSQSTEDVKFADPITYMRLHNEAVRTRDPLGALPYSQTKIDNTINGVNPVYNPATDWQKELFKKFANSQRYNLNVNGGGNVVRYYLATSFTQDNGILDVDKRSDYSSNIDLKRTSVRSNVNIKMTKSTEVIVRFNGTFDDYRGPIDGATDIYQKVLRTNPVLYPAYYEKDADTRYKKHILYGNIAAGQAGSSQVRLGLNPYADLQKGYRDYSRTLLLAQLEIKQDLSSLLDGLKGHLLVNTNRRSYFDIIRQHNPFFYSASYNSSTKKNKLNILNENEGSETLSYSEGPTDVATSFYLQGSLSYNQLFNDVHDVNALLVYLQSSGIRNNTGSFQQSLPSRNMGVSGRFTYGYDSKYFLEFNFGFNGSERFSKDKRFGFFPSIGGAWTVSEEPFFENLQPVISKLKLRVSYGLVGNDAIGNASDRFFYLSQVNLNNAGRGSLFGTNLDYSRPGVSIGRYENPDISWETATKLNAGVELNLFDNKVNVLFDVFKEDRENILMDRAFLPPSMGLEAAVRANVGKAESKGLDFSIDYNHDFGNSLWAQGRVNFTYAKGTFKFFEEPDYSESPWLSRNGQPITQEWGYIAERLFVDEEEVLNSPKQFGNYGAGDIKYRDINEDGIIDFRDQVPIGHPTTPEIVYGFGFSAGYKNFDLSAFFQGSARTSFWIDPRATAPFVDPDNNVYENNALLDVYAKDHWSEENQNIYALWPRLSTEIVENNSVRSTWFTQDGSFLRLKQLEVGYTIPQSLSTKLKVSKLRVYASGINLLTWSKFKLWDPEMAGNGFAYPIQRVFNLGLNVSF
ncbi:MAG: TonB-dependent receptor [Carboxylicivirga sp.]|jgi:TonB-linked SusC/RagA family outer membrane protein|nr:TonB-dependent receptor [Carboxylicivirga sp.]